MKLLFPIVLFCCFAACSSDRSESKVRTDHAAEATVSSRTPVLVELFTSEGCSSCPPADRNLALIEKQQPVPTAEAITLAFHVDYWNRMGWKDRFSSPLFTKRQDIYDSKLGSEVYTPQMIVDGQTAFVGSDSGRASQEIAKAAASAKLRFEIASTDEGMKISIRDLPQHEDATVYAVIAEDDVSSRIDGGENSGTTVQHVSVVRELMPIGTLAAGRGEFEMLFDSQQPADTNIQNLKLVVFAQENVSHRILAIGKGRFTTRKPSV